jgi:hypothetical protein
MNRLLSIHGNAHILDYQLRGGDFVDETIKSLKEDCQKGPLAETLTALHMAIEHREKGRSDGQEDVGLDKVLELSEEFIDKVEKNIIQKYQQRKRPRLNKESK